MATTNFFEVLTRRLELLVFAVFPLVATAQDARPPLTPRWVFMPWMWEDDENTAEAVWDLVRGCERNDIPLGAVIIDSPWEPAYNNFRFDTTRYPNPRQFIAQLHAHGVHAIMWITSMINVSSKDAGADTALWRYCKEHGYFLQDGVLKDWWKGRGSFFDFTNPEAVGFWKTLMDTAFAYGIDGWKTDGTDSFSGLLQAYIGPIDQNTYARYYYCTFAKYTQEKLGIDRGMIVARPRIHGRNRCPVDCLISGWVGDQRKDWSEGGFLEALSDIFDSARHGYAVIGSDIGGYSHRQAIDKHLYVRWAQFGALCPVMETGGLGDHRPWSFDTETLEIYRYYAKLHTELIPYLYSEMIRAHKFGGGIIRPVDGQWEYTLGPDLLVAVIYRDVQWREVRLPEGLWVDYWNEDAVYPGEMRAGADAPLSRLPLYFRAGSAIPLEVADSSTGHGNTSSAGYTTILIFPSHERTTRTFYTGVDDSFTVDFQLRTPTSVAGEVDLTLRGDAGHTLLRVWTPTRCVRVGSSIRGELALFDGREAFDAAQKGAYWDGRHVWVKLPHFRDERLQFRLARDNVPPRLLQVYSPEPTQMNVFFSEPVAPDDAADLRNYTIRAVGLAGHERQSTTLNSPRVLSVRMHPTARAAILTTDPLLPGVTYEVTVASLVDRAGNASHDLHARVSLAASPSGQVPLLTELWLPYPNPARSEVVIRVDMPRNTWARLTVYDVTGRQVRQLVDAELPAGQLSFLWRGQDDAGRKVASGTYLVVLETPTVRQTQKLVWGGTN